MATIDLAVKLNSGLIAGVSNDKFVIKMDDVIIDLAAAAVLKGSALAANDVIEAIDIPAGCVVLAAGIEVITAQTGSTVLTASVGVTGVSAAAYVAAYDLVTATAGQMAPGAAAGYPIPLATADTVDVLIASLTTANTGGTFRVWAVYADVVAHRRPGLAQRKS